MTSIILKNVNKSYGDTIIIENLNLEIREGERTIFLGPSGCGKSTILRMIAGLESITSGEIFLDEENVTHKPSGERNIAIVFQNYALYPHMSVENNILYALKRNKVSKGEREKRLEKVLNMLELKKFRKRMPKDLSGGQRQRVALARATVKQANYFLLDEPLSNLDAKLRVIARRELLKLHEEFTQTFVYVTHDQIEAMALGNRIVVLNKGEVQMVDTPYNVYHHPRNLFTARFIGSPPMNILEGYIQEHKFHFDDQTFDVSQVKSMNSELEDKDVYLGIRPEHMRLSVNDEGDIKGKIIFRENFGAEVAHTIQIGESEIIVMSNKIIEQERVSIIVDREYVHFFDKNTEINYNYLMEDFNEYSTKY